MDKAAIDQSRPRRLPGTLSTPAARTFSASSSSAISRPARRSARAIFRACSTCRLSPASVRNVMADLEDLGLIAAPAHLGRARADPGGPAVLRRCHARSRAPSTRPSAARSRSNIEGSARRARSRTCSTEASALLSGLSQGAGVVIAAKVRHGAQAYRIRPARCRARHGDARGRGRPGGKPHHRPAARAHGQRPDPGVAIISPITSSGGPCSEAREVAAARSGESQRPNSTS